MRCVNFHFFVLKKKEGDCGWVGLTSHYNSPECNNVQLASLALASVKLHLSGTICQHYKGLK